jgi:hypothetical protein
MSEAAPPRPVSRGAVRVPLPRSSRDGDDRAVPATKERKREFECREITAGATHRPTRQSASIQPLSALARSEFFCGALNWLL